MRRRDFLAGAGAWALTARAAEPRPNIVFIITDDQRWDGMSCAGHPVLKTPNMDRVAREGAMFRNAFVTTPLCSPGRASFLTGQYAHRHGVINNQAENNERSHRLITFPRLLHDAGYETAFIGKWHMGNDDTPRPGFDRWVSFKGQGRYNDPALNIDGQRTQQKGYITDILTGHAVDFIRRDREKPFCLYVGHKAIHGPFTPAERHKHLYTTEPIPYSPATKDTLEGKPMLQRPRSAGGRSGRPTGFPEENLRNQMRALMAVDEGLGQVFQALEETGALDNTLLIYTSDNGYFWNEHGLRDKRAAYEDSVRIPLIMRYPKLIRAGTVIDQLAANIDIAPTVLEAGRARRPKSIQGRSLLPLLRGRTRGWRTSLLLEYEQEARFPYILSWKAVRTNGWKYIHYTQEEARGFDELYNLREDPYELNNLIDDPAAQPQLKRLKEELNRLLRTT